MPQQLVGVKRICIWITLALLRYERNDQNGDKAFTGNAMCVNYFHLLFYYLSNDYSIIAMCDVNMF